VDIPHGKQGFEREHRKVHCVNGEFKRHMVGDIRG
jgi:hypothetical protein